MSKIQKIFLLCFIMLLLLGSLLLYIPLSISLFNYKQASLNFINCMTTNTTGCSHKHQMIQYDDTMGWYIQTMGGICMIISIIFPVTTVILFEKPNSGAKGGISKEEKKEVKKR